MNKMNEGFLRKNKRYNRYELNGFMFHCGDGCEIEINGVWVPTRFESPFDSDIWYLVGTGFEGDEIEGLHARR